MAFETTPGLSQILYSSKLKLQNLMDNGVPELSNTQASHLGVQSEQHIGKVLDLLKVKSRKHTLL